MVAEWWQNNRLTLVVGQAGRGKTSLLQADVLPLLADKKLSVLPVGRLSYGATFPSAALPAHNPYTLALLRSWSPDETASRLVGYTVNEFITHRASSLAIFAAIDRADDLLADTGPRSTHRWQFLTELREAVTEGPKLHLLIMGREEAIDMVSGVLGNGARYEVPALTWQGGMEAATRPVAGLGRTFAEGAAEKLITDLQTSCIAADDGEERFVTDDHVEPALLQVACAHLWDSLPADVEFITGRDVRLYGDVDAALVAYTGLVIAQVADQHDLSPKRLTAWLLSTFITELGTQAKAYEGATATAGMPNSVPRALEDRHLLTARPQSGGRWYELLSIRLIEPLRRASDVRVPSAAPGDVLLAAEQALTVGQLDLAERYASEILRTPLECGPRWHAEAWSLLGNLAYEREKPKEAEVRYREAAQLYGAAGDTGRVAYEVAAVGQTLLAQGRVAEAVDELHAAVGRLPQDPVLQTQLAQALWQDDKSSAAVAVLNDVLRLDGGNRAALEARGEILAYLGEAHQALLDLDRLTLQGRPATRAARGLALAELGDQPTARREIEDAVAESRRNGPVLLYAALATALGGDDCAARGFAQQAADASDPPLSPRHREVARQLLSRTPG